MLEWTTNGNSINSNSLNAARELIPYVESFSPWAIPPTDTTEVLITGGNFVPTNNLSIPASALTITGASSVVYSVVSPTKISAIVTTNNASGNLPVVVANGDRLSNIWGDKSIAILSDPYFQSVALFLKGEGENNSTNIIDSSLTPKNLTRFGNIRISTAEKKYENSSIYFDGSGDYLSVSSSPGFAAGTGDFCYEAWIKTSSTKPYMCFFQRSPYASSNGFAFFVNGSSGDGKPEIYWFGWSNSLFFKSNRPSIIDYRWHHLAFCRSGTTCRMFVDGFTAAEKMGVSVTVPAGPISIGNDIDFSDRDYLGFLDSVRITIGQSRYTSDFDPEQATYLNI